METFDNSSQMYDMDMMNPYDDDSMYYGAPMGPEMDVIHGIETYLFPVIMLVGIVGNVLAMPILYVMSMRNWSTIFYLSLLSVVDLLILLVRCGDTWYYQVTMSSLSERIMNSSDALCKTYMFAFHFVLHFSPWLMVAVAIEMTIATRWPQRLYVMCTMERANNVVMLLVLVIVCLTINYFWTWGVPSQVFGCRYTEEFSTEFRDTIWPAMTNIIQFVTPLVIVSVCFFVTAATMIGRRVREEKSIERELKKYFLELATLKDFRVICLVLCVVFMCLTFFTIIINLVDFLEVKGYIELDDEAYMSYHVAMTLVKTLQMTFYALFYSLKIFLYVGYSSTFRATLRQGFLCFRRKIKKALVRAPRPGRSKAYSTNGENRKGAEEGSCSDTNISNHHQSKPLIDYNRSTSTCSYMSKPEELLSEEHADISSNPAHHQNSSTATNGARNSVLFQDRGHGTDV